MPVAHFAQFVGAHLVHRGAVRLLVALHRDEGRHAAHREGAAAMAGIDQPQRVGCEERLIHRHRRPVGRQPVGASAEPLDRREDIIPAAAVQPDDILSQRVEDLVHLERRRDGLDQDRRLDRPALQPQPVLGQREDIAPQRRFLRALELGDVEIWVRSPWPAPSAHCARRRWRNRRRRPRQPRRSTVTWSSGKWSPRGRTISTAGSSPTS